ncbi:MAG: DUF6481 family protein [Alsobacter sp.]
MAFRVSFNDRMTASENARRAMRERFVATSQANDPSAAERRAQRAAVALAREQRQREREERAAAEKVQKAEAAALAEAELELRTTLEAAEREERQRDLLAQQKAARDARYAARKAKKR